MHEQHLRSDNLDAVRDLQERDAYSDSNYTCYPPELLAVEFDLACPHFLHQSAQTLLR